jgi:crotonobetainyl-CoA:carnitine CoA-transferase CaiB-like acyl-CoA transferase
MLDCQQQELVTYLNTGKLPPRTGEPLANAWINAPYGIYRTKDSWITLAMAPLDILGDVLDNDVLRSMHGWANGATRRDEIYCICKAALPARTTAEWIETFDRHQIWSGPVHDYPAVESDPHVQATGMIAEISHPNPKIGAYRQPNVPVQMSGTPMRIDRHAPMLGEHTREVLREILGYNEARIAALYTSGAL